MRSSPDPEVALDVMLSAICGRNQYARDPEPIVAELTAAARGRADILARVAGIWSGYHDSPVTQPLADAAQDPWRRSMGHRVEASPRPLATLSADDSSVERTRRPASAPR